MLYQIDSAYFCAGIVVNDNKIIIETAPIVAWMKGKSISFIKGYCSRKSWKIIEV